MKFHELPIGQQFELDGEVYLKSGPLVASHAQTGKQKFMARSAMVGLLGQALPTAQEQPQRLISADTAIAAFEEYYQRSLQLLAVLPAAQQQAARDELAQGRKVFLDSLN